MPWPKAHKALTRDRIVQAAATAFRGRGVAGVRVDEIMGEAGLTHGGFYAHFSSKEELLGAALEHASCQTLETFSKVLESVPPERRLRAVIDTYLSPQHVAHPDRGCPVAALGPELARAGGAPRRDLARALRRRLGWLRALDSPPGRPAPRDDKVAGALACMVGGVILARIAGGKEAEALLQSCRDFLHESLGEDAPPLAPKVRAAIRPRRNRSPRRRTKAE
jgi:TetR/AcrR family transcriptional repressor of nem operon